MRRAARILVEHHFEPDPNALRLAIEALLRFSEETRVRRTAPEVVLVRPIEAQG